MLYKKGLIINNQYKNHKMEQSNKKKYELLGVPQSISILNKKYTFKLSIKG